MADYAALKTPVVADTGSPRSPSSMHDQATNTPPSRSLSVHVVRFLIVLSIAAFVFGNIATWAPLYELQLVNTMKDWWNGYPDMPDMSSHSHAILDTGIGRNLTETGHTEMIRPTFLLLFCIGPFLASVLLIELLRHLNTARRLTSTLIWRVAMLLRRKPQLPMLGVSRFSLGEWIVGVVYVLGGNGLCWYFQWDRRIDMATEAGTLDTTKYWNIVGISSSYLCIYNMSFLLLPVTRNCGWMEFCNVSYTNGVKFHRWTGFMTVLTAVVHMAGYWGSWVRKGQWQVNQLPCTRCDFTLDNSGGGYYAWFNVFGFVSTLALVLMIPTSFPIIRRKAYEWFYISHWVLFVVAVFFAILHWAQILWWILPSGCVWFVSRTVSSSNALTPVTVAEFAVLGEADDELVKIVLKRAAPGTSPCSPSYDYKVGNFVYLNVPPISKLQWHAFTIASSPKTSVTDVVLLVKPLGDWSQDLVQYAAECHRDHTSPLVYMDGFYGASLELYEDYSAVCLVAGGIGVTPVLAVLDDLVAKLSRNGVAWTQRFTFIFTFRELSVLQTVAPVLAKLRQLDPHEQFFRSHLFATGTYSDVSLTRHLEVLPRDESLDAAAAKTMGRAARPFYEPLRSSNGLRFVLFLVLYVVAIAVVFTVRWGNGIIQGDDRFELWPLERAFQLLMFCLTIVVVYAFVGYEYKKFGGGCSRMNAVTGSAVVPMTSARYPLAVDAFGGDVHSVRDLLGHLNVTMGERPQLQSLLQQTLAIHSMDDSSASVLPVVGVIVSGPESLKVATNDAVVALGRRHFDVHEEEFEL
ncbi:unnamed protein product [Hyaloperonospora brassicae]|uniref:FAD-binding FR-type domain-containing protein n=1 Tax=Hyaloperonospora brassicae TaxID=162125 RepID=A0AAV0TUQ0_HYABA|nr:unnamed protein product [Hyaloperonospora brassicae]